MNKIKKKQLAVRISDIDKDACCEKLERNGFLLKGNRKPQKILDAMISQTKSSSEWLILSQKDRNEMSRILVSKGFLEEKEKNPELVLEAMIKFVRENK